MSHSSFEIWKAVLEDPESQLPQGMLMSGCDHTCQPRRDDSPVANLLDTRTRACVPWTPD